MRFVFAAHVGARARLQALARDRQRRLRDVLRGVAADRRAQAQHRHGAPQRFAIFRRPALHQLPRRFERRVVIENADPERRQRAQARPRARVRAAHFEEGLQAHFREDRRQVIVEIVHRRQFARQHRQLARHEVAERQARRVDVFAVAIARNTSARRARSRHSAQSPMPSSNANGSMPVRSGSVSVHTCER